MSIVARAIFLMKNRDYSWYLLSRRANHPSSLHECSTDQSGVLGEYRPHASARIWLSLEVDKPPVLSTARNIEKFRSA